MPHSHDGSSVKPCRACGRPVILGFRQHVAVVLTGTGERRIFHRKCVPALFRPIDPFEDLAA